MKELSLHPTYLLQLYSQYLQQSVNLGDVPITFEDFERDYTTFEAPVISSFKGNDFGFEFEADPIASLLPFPTNQKQPQHRTFSLEYLPEQDINLNFDSMLPMVPMMQQQQLPQLPPQPQMILQPQVPSPVPQFSSNPSFYSDDSSQGKDLDVFGAHEQSDSEFDSDFSDNEEPLAKKGSKKSNSNNRGSSVSDESSAKAIDKQQAGGIVKQRKKPGRKPKILDEDTKRERGKARQEKNRIAARKCREKKQQYYIDLEQEVEVLRAERVVMSEELRLLREEVSRLRASRS